MPEVLNAVQQAPKEIQQRYDLKDSKSSIELKEKENKILLASAGRVQAEGRDRHPGIQAGEAQGAAEGPDFRRDHARRPGPRVRQEITLQQGIAIEKAREIVKTIKDSKMKVQASIQGDFVRVAGKDRDTLQEVIAAAARPRFRHRHAVHQLPDELKWPRRIESLFVDGPAGQLEALLEEPETGAPRTAALVCHPHPQFGGTMHNKVVYRHGPRVCGARERWCCASTIAA